MIEALAGLSPPAQLLLPLFLHFGLVVGLYAALTWARIVAVRRGDAAKANFSPAPTATRPCPRASSTIWPTSSRRRSSRGSRCC